MEVGQHHDLAPALDRAEGGKAHDLTSLVDADGRPRALAHDEVGVRASQGPEAVIALAAAPAPAQQQRGEGARRPPLAHSLGPHEQVGVHRRPGGGPELGHDRGLAQDRGEDVAHDAPWLARLSAAHLS